MMSNVPCNTLQHKGMIKDQTTEIRESFRSTQHYDTTTHLSGIRATIQYQFASQVRASESKGGPLLRFDRQGGLNCL